ncbi:protein kinase domain-containing protein [Citrus sinensis]|nr:protein kinase domain-containing protein [Citrus sinensis]
MYTLKYVNFRGNQLSGAFPSFIFNKSSLQDLDFSYNALSGEIPANICSNLPFLESISLSQNMFHGGIPSTLSNCKYLEILSLSINNLLGAIPKEIGNLTKLKELYLGYSGLQGEIPREFGNLAELELMALQVSNLQGEIPQELANLTGLEVLKLDKIFLTGEIPPEIHNLHNLKLLDLSHNKLVGAVPATIFNMSTLTGLGLQSNSLSGSLSSIADVQLPNLEELRLWSNNFSGTIPRVIFNASKLSVLELGINSFSGFIPNTFGNLRNLRLLTLHYNYLTSSNLELSFLSSFSNCKSLTYIGLSNNPLDGILPRMSMGNLSHSLEYFDLSYCNVSGGFPEEIGNLTNLIGIYLRGNKLNGSIPITLGKLQKLQDRFSENNLIGRGGFGSVYKARIGEGMEVAVKVFDLQCGRAFKSFDVECEIMKSIRHRNLIKVISSCSTEEFKALVLEYMPHGSLEKNLYSSNCILDIFQRLNIMVDVATALEYLHFGYSAPVIHCDLKPNNVLLDDNMVAHLSDFGIAKLLIGEDQSMTQTQTLATIGYMAPAILFGDLNGCPSYKLIHGKRNKSQQSSSSKLMGQGQEHKTRPQSQVEIQERGEIFFFYRPKVGKEEAHSSDDVQRLYLVLRPESGERSVEQKQDPESGKEGAKKEESDSVKHGSGSSEGGHGSKLVNIEKELLLRFIVMGRKSLPDPREKSRPYWGFVEMVTTKVEDVKVALAGEEYDTSTRGHRRNLPARAVGEGVYRILRHSPGKKMHTHLIYKLEFPPEDMENETQESLNIEHEGSFLIQIKKPGQHGTSQFRGLQNKRKAVFPAHLQGQFGQKRYCPADPPDFLNYEGCEFLLISASDDIEEELGLELKTDEGEADESCSDLIKTFGETAPTSALLRGTWV